MESLIDKINAITFFQKQIEHIHPLLKRCFPVVVATEAKLDIYDINSENTYNFIKSIPNRFGFIKSIRAAFPIQVYDNRIACIITSDIFSEKNCYATIFHEFIHCQQFELCENELKNTIKIYNDAKSKEDSMWEINFPFPYIAKEFIEYYETQQTPEMLTVLIQYRNRIKASLGLECYEYMNWEEWKEGFARYIETQITKEIGLSAPYPKQNPTLARDSLYITGERFIRALISKSADNSNIGILYETMYNNEL